MKKKEISLEDFLPVGTTSLSGRSLAISVRNLSNIDREVAANDEVHILIPEQISSATPSFLKELLENIIHNLDDNEVTFKHKVKFHCNGRYKIETDLEVALGSILRQEFAYSY